MLTPHCKLRFNRLKKTDLNALLHEVKNGLYSHPTVFVLPPIAETAYQQVQTTYTNAQAAYEAYGITQKVAYTDARKAMFDTLYALAQYVEGIAQGNVSTIALSGFTPSVVVPKKNERVDKIAHFDISRTNVEGELIIEIPVILGKGIVHYSCLCIKGPEVPEVSLHNGQIHINSSVVPLLLDTTKSRKKKFTQLIPGSLYHLYVYATNTVSVSPISDVKSVWAS